MSIVYDFADIAARMNCRPEAKQELSPAEVNEHARQYLAGAQQLITPPQTLKNLYQAAATGNMSGIQGCSFNLPDFRGRVKLGG